MSLVDGAFNVDVAEGLIVIAMSSSRLGREHFHSLSVIESIAAYSPFIHAIPAFTNMPEHLEGREGAVHARAR